MCLSKVIVYINSGIMESTDSFLSKQPLVVVPKSSKNDDTYDDVLEIEEDALDDIENTRVSSTRFKALLSEIGIDDDVQKCLNGIRNAKNKYDVERYKAKLDAFQKIVAIYKTVADTANKSSVIPVDSNAADEVKITLQR